MRTLVEADPAGGGGVARMRTVVDQTVLATEADRVADRVVASLVAACR